MKAALGVETVKKALGDLLALQVVKMFATVIGLLRDSADVTRVLLGYTFLMGLFIIFSGELSHCHWNIVTVSFLICFGHCRAEHGTGRGISRGLEKFTQRFHTQISYSKL